jgi:hypothetical protein
MAIQPQGIGGVLDTAFQLYKASLGVVWPICLLLSIVASPPSLYMLKSGGANVGDPANALQMMAVLSDPVYWLVYLVSLALIMWVVGALYLKQYSIGVDAEMSLGTALQTSLGRAGVLLLMVLLFILAMSIGLVLLIIPGLIVMVSLMLSTNLVMFEGKGPVAALTGSHKLVAHRCHPHGRFHPRDGHLHGRRAGHRPHHAFHRPRPRRHRGLQHDHRVAGWSLHEPAGDAVLLGAADLLVLGPEAAQGRR